jgi:hypothetical protein
MCQCHPTIILIDIVSGVHSLTHSWFVFSDSVFLCVFLLFSSLTTAGRCWQLLIIHYITEHRYLLLRTVGHWQQWSISMFDRKTYNFGFCCENYRIFRTFILLHKFYRLTRFLPLKYFLFLAKLLLHNFPRCRGAICIKRRRVTAIHLQVYASILIQRNKEEGKYVTIPTRNEPSKEQLCNNAGAVGWSQEEIYL